MNRSEQRIVAAARRVRGLCPSLEAEALCAALDVSLLRTDLGMEADSIKGFLLRSNRCSTAVINSALPPELQRVILFHELGHAVFHVHLVARGHGYSAEREPLLQHRDGGGRHTSL